MATRLTVCASGKLLRWSVEDWTTLIAIAALSAEPETFDDFFEALRRYHPDHDWDETGQPAAIEDALHEDLPSCFIDMDSHSVFAAGGYELPERNGVYEAEKNDRPEGIPCAWLNTPDDWMLENAGADWLALTCSRAHERARRPRVDTRAVLFGEPVLQFIANRVAAAASKGHQGQSLPHAELKAIHAQWLMTIREDLLGCTPRDVLLRNRTQIDRELQHRSEQWSMQGFPPPALTPHSAAYRFGGYGTVEIVIYFDLVRSLLQFAWDQVVQGLRDENDLVSRLAAHQIEFLQQPQEDSSSVATCRELIESERHRLPITDDGNHLDCDCPLCQAMAAGDANSQPSFLFFDGYHLEMEDEFAFSLAQTREEWEEQQGIFGSFQEDCDL